MICLETSFLVRYLRGDEWTESYLESVGPEVPIVVSSVSLYELFAGAILSLNESVERTRQRLPGVEILDFDEAVAEEAAEIRASLLDHGEPIPAPDTLIAGTARSEGAQLVAVDEHFGRVPDLDVYDPRDDFDCHLPLLTQRRSPQSLRECDTNDTPVEPRVGMDSHRGTHAHR